QRREEENATERGKPPGLLPAHDNRLGQNQDPVRIRKQHDHCRYDESETTSEQDVLEQQHLTLLAGAGLVHYPTNNSASSGVLSPCSSTRSPGRSCSNNSSTSRLSIRMQPCDRR